MQCCCKHNRKWIFKCYFVSSCDELPLLVSRLHPFCVQHKGMDDTLSFQQWVHIAFALHFVFDISTSILLWETRLCPFQSIGFEMILIPILNSGKKHERWELNTCLEWQGWAVSRLWTRENPQISGSEPATATTGRTWNSTVHSSLIFTLIILWPAKYVKIFQWSLQKFFHAC